MSPCANTGSNLRLRRKHAARGVTLVELLVVVTILMLITAATIPVLRPAIQSRRVREASRLVSSYFAAARSRAAETGRFVGVVIERYPPSLSNASTVTTSTNTIVPYSMNLSMAESPPPYAGDTTTSQVTITSTGTIGQVSVAFTDTGWTSQKIRIGDAIRFGGRGPLYYFDFGSSNTPATNGYITNSSPWTASLLSTLTVGTQTIDLPPIVATGQSVSFQVFRQPVRSSVDPLQLPEGIVIDMLWSGMSTEPNGVFSQITGSGTPPNPVITFAPSGSVAMLYDTTPANANSAGPLPATGPIYLLLGRPAHVGGAPLPSLAAGALNNLGDPNSLWVTIAPQTGAVGINPNYNPNPGTNLQPSTTTLLIQARSLASGSTGAVTNEGGG